jgi:hypothetical protein
MNEFLADIYNTRESIGATSADNSDVEKLAEAQLLDEALRAEGVDIDKLSGDTILKLAHQLLGDDSALVKAAAEEGKAHEEGESAEKEEGEEEEHKEGEKSASEETFEEKVAQADFLGRVMAHSFRNEQVAIEKDAAVPAGLKKGWEAAKSGAGKGWEALKKYHKGAVEDVKKGVKGGTKMTGKRKDIEGPMNRKDRALSAAKGVAKFLPHAATATATGVGIHHATKKASAIDVLAEKRAMEWAEAHGLIENEQPEETKLAAAVDARAAEMLAEAGIDVDAVEAAAQK